MKSDSDKTLFKNILKLISGEGIGRAVGFLMTYWTAGYIDASGGWLRRLLCYIGDHTLYILLWHIPAFKVVSLMKIHYYQLDPAQIGCHMVIHFNNTDFFWVLYSIAGVALPLLAYRVWQSARARIPALARLPQP